MTSVVMIGATGAVGGHCARAVSGRGQLTSLGRRVATGIDAAQHVVDLADPPSYAAHLAGQSVAICCLGVGEPSKVTRDEFRRIDHDIPLGFATAARAAGVGHFLLLSSVGANAASPSFFLRTKGQLEDGLRALAFDRLSLFHPSMILTPENRYGLSQALTLAIWPRLTPLLRGPLRRFRGIAVDRLGQAIAATALGTGRGEEVLEWPQIVARADQFGVTSTT
ncbi:NAD(P)H-binding protein [Jannaschia pohangensis]|uniref:Uncharacterized conserved protein YbjT, contains NAD(P)-binding and DUF2867 domains n=1 Tax=Jannaschia pohangensis TaxID=390807 RepID=A0A1I3IR16_9RHOB|nr:NAD(P)H-binding protein [Jannaschia pohangensis]SFI50416.1 Uncharacterized conserved protein YbjT, contains NAD(P)-binding and DUF2867 domains [Jannaschia pohangensis]